MSIHLQIKYLWVQVLLESQTYLLITCFSKWCHKFTLAHSTVLSDGFDGQCRHDANGNQVFIENKEQSMDVCIKSGRFCLEHFWVWTFHLNSAMCRIIASSNTGHQKAFSQLRPNNFFPIEYSFLWKSSVSFPSCEQ